MSKKLVVIDDEGNPAPNVDPIEFDETKPELLLRFPDCFQTDASIRCILISNTVNNALNDAILENFEFDPDDDVDEDEGDPNLVFESDCYVGRDLEESTYRAKINVFRYGKKTVYHGRIRFVEE